MGLRLGDRVRGSNFECVLQVMVMGTGYAKETLLRCSCGSPMKKSDEQPAVSRRKATVEESAAAGVRGPR